MFYDNVNYLHSFSWYVEDVNFVVSMAAVTVVKKGSQINAWKNAES